MLGPGAAEVRPRRCLKNPGATSPLRGGGREAGGGEGGGSHVQRLLSTTTNSRRG